MGEIFDSGLMATDKPRVVVYMDEEIKAALEILASTEDRSVSNYVLQLVKRAVAEAQANGILPKNNDGREGD